MSRLSGIIAGKFKHFRKGKMRKKRERERERGRPPRRQKDQFDQPGDWNKSKGLNLAADDDDEKINNRTYRMAI
jgi:hypothetical protein